MGKFLFVCTGNTCRSPLAESYARDRYPHMNISSRGLHTADNSTNSHSLEIIKSENLPSPSAPKQLTGDDVNESTLLVMGSSHKNAILSHWPTADVHLISEYAAGETVNINDPYGGSKKEYEAVFHQLKNYIDKFQW